MKDKKPYGYWRNEDTVISEVRRVMEAHNLDSLPSQKWMNKYGYSSLSTAINEYHGGFRKLRELIGEQQKRTESNLLMNLDYILHQSKNIMEEHSLDNFPSWDWMIQHSYSSLAAAINKYHGGFRKLRELIGEQQKRREMGILKNLDYVVGEVRKIMEEVGLEEMPSDNWLSKNGYSGLSSAIYKYHGGFHRLRKLMGGQQKKRKDGVWKNLDYVVGEIKRVMEEKGFSEVPSQKWLIKHSNSSLASIIGRYHGGFRRFRKLMGGQQKTTESTFLKDKDYVVGRVRNIMEENEFGELPSAYRLVKLGYSGLAAAIGKYHSGFPAFRKYINQTTGVKSEKEKMEDLLKRYIGAN